MPLFSVIVVHYQGSISRSIFERGMKCLADQTFKDFETLIYHDGPMVEPGVSPRWHVRCTKTRHNDWGHSLRDIGIREAKGDYIVHFNADNILYPNALEEIENAIIRPCLLKNEEGEFVDSNDIIIFPVKMRGYMRFMNKVYSVGRDSGYYTIVTGSPPAMYCVDCMQLVMKRELWLAEGGWSDKRPDSDGRMYPKFAEKYGYRTVGPVLGEHC